MTPGPLPQKNVHMLKIAITGGAGLGKSVVARMFQELGAAVLDADTGRGRSRRIYYSERKSNYVPVGAGLKPAPTSRLADAIYFLLPLIIYYR